MIIAMWFSVTAPGILAQLSTQPTVLEETKRQRTSSADCKAELSEIGVAELNPKYSPWREKLRAFEVDARRILAEAEMDTGRCLADRVPQSSICDHAYGRKAKLGADMLALSSLADRNAIHADDDQTGTKRQVEEWTNHGFMQIDLKIKHYAGSETAFQLERDRARKLMLEAGESSASSDWIGALISLRNSQLLMNDASDLAIHKFYSK